MITFTLLPTCCPQGEEVCREILKCIKFSTASSELLISSHLCCHFTGSAMSLSNPLSTASAGAYAPNSGTPTQHSDRNLQHREGNGSTPQRVRRQRNVRVGFGVGFVKEESGFLYFFSFSALHCCHQVCPGVTASRVPEPSHWCSTKAAQVPPSTAHVVLHYFGLNASAKGPTLVPGQPAAPSTKGLIKMNSLVLGLSNSGESSQANSGL